MAETPFTFMQAIAKRAAGLDEPDAAEAETARKRNHLESFARAVLAGNVEPAETAEQRMARRREQDLDGTRACEREQHQVQTRQDARTIEALLDERLEDRETIRLLLASLYELARDWPLWDGACECAEFAHYVPLDDEPSECTHTRAWAAIARADGRS